MNQLQLTQPDAKKYGMMALTVVLWLIVAVLTMFVIFALRELFIWSVATVLSEPGDAERRLQVTKIINLTQQCFVIFTAVLGLGLVMSTTDYLFKHAGQPRFIRRLLIIIALEAALVLPVAYIFWI